MRRPGPFPEHLKGRVFSRAQAAAAGLSASRLRSRDVRRVRHGWYRWVGLTPRSIPPLVASAVEAARAEEIARLQEICTRYPDAVVTGESVARLQRWPLPADVATRVRPTVLRPRGRRAVPDEDVVTRTVDPSRVIVRRPRPHSVPEASFPDAWFHLAPVLEPGWLVTVGDHLARRSDTRGIRALAGREDLHRALERHRGETGARRARQALAVVREGSDSPPETELRLALVAAGLPEPDLQIELWDADYSIFHPASADLGYWRWKIAVQYEGKGHDGAAQVGKDTRRDAVFQRAGWIVIRVAGPDRARGFVETVELVRRAIAQRQAYAPAQPW
ncbi:hypothetical protein [Micrococcus sp.]|uniref:hypothetical protein n=1 Tax=Micrococcus sp. TaxID=1271 RepID=UPI002A9105FC|nr:hypothetical protein [Micrococcus sp.]MDY6055039.1 hypothetical protein [Micrococcus sp.]